MKAKYEAIIYIYPADLIKNRRGKSDFEPVMATKYKLVAPPSMRRTVIDGCPVVASYAIPGEQWMMD